MIFFSNVLTVRSRLLNGTSKWSASRAAREVQTLNIHGWSRIQRWINIRAVTMSDITSFPLQYDFVLWGVQPYSISLQGSYCWCNPKQCPSQYSNFLAVFNDETATPAASCCYKSPGSTFQCKKNADFSPTQITQHENHKTQGLQMDHFLQHSSLQLHEGNKWKTLRNHRSTYNIIEAHTIVYL